MFHEETPLPTQAMPMLAKMNSTKEGWEILRQEDNMRQKALTLKSIALDEDQFIEWSNNNGKEIESVTSFNWMELSHLREEAPIPIRTQDMQDSGDDEDYDEKSIRPHPHSMIEESHVISSDFDHMIWEKNHDVIVPILEEKNHHKRETSPR